MKTMYGLLLIQNVVIFYPRSHFSRKINYQIIYFKEQHGLKKWFGWSLIILIIKRQKATFYPQEVHILSKHLDLCRVAAIFDLKFLIFLMIIDNEKYIKRLDTWTEDCLQGTGFKFNHCDLIIFMFLVLVNK